MATIANTKQGQISGIEKFGSLQFRNIPFAEPPVGLLRWKSPRPPASWDGVRDGSEFGPICPQLAGTMEALSGGRVAEPDPQSEDCLTLNVFTPALGDDRRPVMVWIHGGGFAGGSGRVPWYSAHNFARDGIVVVTINYRLNAFGALQLEPFFGPDYADSGSLGIQDQVAALEWVSDNITNFGGDPDNVTIFGESAGGMSVSSLMAAPAAKGLFQKAIPQSGAGHATTPSAVAANIAERFLETVGVEPGDTAALHALTVEEILAAVETVGASLSSENAPLFGEDWAGMSMPFQPVTGGSFLPRPPHEAIADGSAAEVDTLIGTCLEEWKLFTVMLSPEALKHGAVRPLRNLCARAGRSVDDLVDVYRTKIEPGNEKSLRDVLETDRNFRIPAIRLAESQVKAGANVWMYRFDWRTPAFGGALGACHALEIPFVFENLDAPGVSVFTGGEAPPELAEAMHAAWVAFAKVGAPNVESLPTWPRYDLSERQTMLLDAECSTASDPDGDTRALWDGLL